MRKSLHIISSVVVFFIIIILILLTGVRIFGIVPYNYSDGSIIYVKPTTDYTQISVGDRITYILNEDNHIATNVVYSINEDKRFFYIKSSDLSYATSGGDSALNVDGEPVVPVSFDSLIGKTVATIPYIGYISQYMGQKQGFTIIMAFMLFFVILLICTMPKKKRIAGEPDVPIDNTTTDKSVESAIHAKPAKPAKSAKTEPIAENSATVTDKPKKNAHERPSQNTRRLPSEIAQKKYSRTAQLPVIDKKSKKN